MRSKRHAYLIFILLVLASFFLGSALFALAYSGLLDSPTVVSLVVAELAVAIILYYLLGERHRDNVDELLNLNEASDKFSHLDFYIVKATSTISYVYVENKITKKVYRMPKYLGGAWKSGVIPTIAEVNIGEFEKLIKKKGFDLIDRQPSFNEIKAT